MSYRLRIPEEDVFGEGKFTNEKGETECVEFVRKATGAPETPLWKPGLRVADAKPGEILRGYGDRDLRSKREVPDGSPGQARGHLSFT
jgi:hypothetical protein